MMGLLFTVVFYSLPGLSEWRMSFKRSHRTGRASFTLVQVYLLQGGPERCYRGIVALFSAEIDTTCFTDSLLGVVMVFPRPNVNEKLNRVGEADV